MGELGLAYLSSPQGTITERLPVKHCPSKYDIMDQGGGYLTYFLCYDIFFFFQNYQNLGWLSKITFTFDMCLCSWAAEIPVNYECDLKHLSNCFAIL